MNTEYENTGFEFVKKLRPFGCVLVIICFIGFLAVCFTSGNVAEIPGYTPMHDAQYYAKNPAELVLELERDVLPNLSGVVSCSQSEGRAEVVLEKGSFFATRSTLLKYFDESLLDIKQAD